MTRLAINGFGRIGRNFLRCVMQDPQARAKLQVVAINCGPARLDMLADLFIYDSLMGIYKGTVTYKDNVLTVDGHAIEIITELDPSALDWHKRNIDWVVECTGHFTKREGAQKHIQSGARAVLISAPAKGEDVTIIPGVNDAAFDAKKHTIVSLGSCTTNAFAPILKIMHDTFTIERCCMTTVHAYTNTQVLLDVESSDPRRARAAALNIIPTSTGAMEVVTRVLPELEGRIEATALRVPVPTVSLIDATIMTGKAVSVAAINKAFEQAADSATMRGIVGVTNKPLVSSDFRGDSHSVVIDSLLTQINGDRVAKLFGWYDNEWGYSERLKDFLYRCER